MKPNSNFSSFRQGVQIYRGNFDTQNVSIRRNGEELGSGDVSLWVGSLGGNFDSFDVLIRGGGEELGTGNLLNLQRIV